MNVKSFPLNDTDTFSPSVIEYVNWFPSISVAESKKLRSVSSSTFLFPTVDKTGASFTGLTVTVIVCESESSSSETVTINDSLP